MVEDKVFITYSIFEEYDLINYTTTTFGGISSDEYSSLNLSLYSNDNLNNVLENRNILANHIRIPIEQLFVPYQSHDDKIVVIDKSFLTADHHQQEKFLHGVDALITQEKGIAIGITTADCVPLILYDPKHHVLAAVHAGWKGTAARIAAKTLKQMQEQFSSLPSDVIVAIGPSISPEVFEVGDEVGEAFAKEGFDLNTISFRNVVTEKLHINLWEANKEQLLDLGVKSKNIEIAGICTYQSESFFSARRQTINSGRMLTGGVLK